MPYILFDLLINIFDGYRLVTGCRARDGVTPSHPVTITTPLSPRDYYDSAVTATFSIILKK